MRPIYTEDDEETILDIEARNVRADALKSIEVDPGCYHCRDLGAMALVRSLFLRVPAGDR